MAASTALPYRTLWYATQRSFLHLYTDEGTSHHRIWDCVGRSERVGLALVERILGKYFKMLILKDIFKGFTLDRGRKV